ncbi:MAG TPA: tetratricopeptide repeat protein [Salinivirgaceae bacterium]|nr:tetratricopeptide repeat protein [Salinivirgaceae bacterium]HQA75667.1 tetratricopeptide repeat protein [Salinivirgaceae bacterium]
MYRIVFSLIAMSVFWTVKGQDKSAANALDKNQKVAYYDSLTFALYSRADYKSLITKTKEAERLGVTFQYLNYRKAIAYYELKNYAKAVKYYEKALYDVPYDMFLKESLYSAYILSGLDAKAAIFAKTLPIISQNKVGFSPLFVSFVQLYGGYTFSDNDEKMRNIIANLDSINQYQDMISGGAMFGLNISDNVKLIASYNLFNTKFERFAQNRLQHTDLLSQHQLNIGTEIYLKNNFSLGFTGGFYAIEKNHKPTAQISGNGPGQGRRRTISSSQSTDYNLSALLFFNKRFTCVSPEISFAYSDFAFSNQLQSKLQLTYYPFGNLNFYGITSGAIILDSNKNRGEQTVFSQSLGVKLFGRMWLDGMISVGNHLNYITERSFIVYDTYDPIMFISSFNLSYYFKKNTVSATYSWSQKEGWAFTNYYANLIKYKYNNQLVNLTIKWNL